MARCLGSKCKQCRREKMKLFLKGERCYIHCPIDKKGAVPPGQKGSRTSFKRMSDYGRQLREKQKIKKIYGISEKQLKNYFKKAFKNKQSTSEFLLQMLETRLDNVVYRLKFAPSRSLSRQIVDHKHVLVDGKKVNIPSYQLKPEQIISLNSKILETAAIKKSLAEKAKMPDWLKRKAAVGQIVRFPKRDEIEADIDDQLIVEYYSR
ncbi:MAG: 30S ribosomal protein S4 [Candidatus Shapirobacteria bacterium]|nr:30S ribosomal protein S4 [Candidatus Shapirobacteria bacterium]